MRFRLFVAAAVAVVAACSGEVSSPSGGRAVIASRSDELSVGDTMTLNPGVLYNDGRWVPLTNVNLTVGDTSIASIDSASRLMRGKKPGLAVVTLEIPQVGSITRDFFILP